MKKILTTLRCFAIVAIIPLLVFSCSKSYNTPSGDCKTCEIKNASGDHIDNVKFCSETEKSSYLAGHPGYTMECN